MDKKQLIDFVNRLKESGINASVTKPRSQLLLPLQPRTNPSSIALNPFAQKKQAVN